MDTSNEAWSEAAAALCAADLRSYLTPGLEQLFDRLVARMGGHEGSIWIHDPAAGSLVIGYNSGPRAAAAELAAAQPSDSGLVSKAFREDRTVHHEGLFRAREQSGEVDTALGQTTHHQISVPLRLAGQVRGAVTVVQLADSEPRPEVQWGFTPDDVQLAESLTTVTAELLELAWRRRTYS